jgi:hypothetical protein
MDHGIIMSKPYSELTAIAELGCGLANFILNDPNPAWKKKAGEFIGRVEKRLQGSMKKNNVM